MNFPPGRSALCAKFPAIMYGKCPMQRYSARTFLRQVAKYVLRHPKKCKKTLVLVFGPKTKCETANDAHFRKIAALRPSFGPRLFHRHNKDRQKHATLSPIITLSTKNAILVDFLKGEIWVRNQIFSKIPFCVRAPGTQGK